MTFEVTDTDGTVRSFTLRPFHEWTIADWHRLMVPANDLEGLKATHEEIKRLTGIPLKLIRRMRPADYDTLLNALSDAYAEAAKAKTFADEIVAQWKDDGPKTIEHLGVTYAVPDDLEMGTVYGQWEDLENILSDAQTEPEVMAAVCATLMVEQGKEYEGYPKTLEAMQSLPVSKAMLVTGFFLTRSERLMSAISRCLILPAMSSLQGQGQGEASMTTVTGAGTD